MERMQPIEFLLSTLAVKTNQSVFCFDRCIVKEQLQKELTREQEQCLGMFGSIFRKLCWEISAGAEACHALIVSIFHCTIVLKRLLTQATHLFVAKQKYQNTESSTLSFLNWFFDIDKQQRKNHVRSFPIINI